jgi:hypothetical protein
MPVNAAPAAVQLIYYGWDNPSIAALPTVLPKLARSPFDGMAVNTTQHAELFTIVPYPIADFADDLKTLESMPLQKLASSYLVIHAAADEKFDWADDNHWAAVQQNLKSYAQILKAGNFKGIVFDMEPYGKSPWSYGTQVAASKTTFSDLAAHVRKRGADMMTMLQSEIPKVEIWALYGLSANQEAYLEISEGTDRSSVLQGDGYGLWPAFFNGWIDAARDNTGIIDGNEPSYYYTKRQDFFDAQNHIKNDLQILLTEDVRKKYRDKIQLGQAVFVDGLMNSSGSPRFIGYYFKTEAMQLAFLKSNIQNAIQSSQSLVWIYSEIPKWWESEPIVKIDNAIREAKAAGLGYSILPDREDAAQAEKALSERISIGGKITDKFGKGIKPSGFKPALANLACSTWGDEGAYGCDFPKGTKITVEPIILNRLVSPRRVVRAQQLKSDWDVNFVVK